MWNLIGTPKTMRVTKKLATQFAEMEAAPQDRPLSERRLQVYEKLAKEGGFRPCGWASVFCKETGGVYRVNGKHTSTLFSGLDLESLPSPLYAVVEEYECETLEDVAKLYSTYDSRLQSRNASDINRAFAACVPELVGVDSRSINLVISGISYHFHLDNYHRIQPAVRAEQILEHSGFAIWLFNSLGLSGSHNTHTHLKRVPVVGAIFGTYRKAQGDALAFWTAVRDETGATPTLPDRKLARFLLTNVSDKASHTDKSSRYRTGSREFYVKSLSAWNAWRQGVQTDLKYFANAKVPTIK